MAVGNASPDAMTVSALFAPTRTIRPVPGVGPGLPVVF